MDSEVVESLCPGARELWAQYRVPSPLLFDLGTVTALGLVFSICKMGIKIVLPSLGLLGRLGKSSINYLIHGWCQ